jgi:hypothetical protein
MIEQLTGRPEPVVNAAVWGGLVSALIAFLRAMGWLELDNAQYDALMNFLTILIPLLAPVITAIALARPKVTPVSDPQNNQGQPMVVEDGR